MGKVPHRNHERAERRISAATSLLMCALTVLAQIAVTLLLVHFLKEKASFDSPRGSARTACRGRVRRRRAALLIS